MFLLTVKTLDAYVTITGTADESASTFVVVGTDRFGNYQREEFIGSTTAGGTAKVKSVLVLLLKFQQNRMLVRLEQVQQDS